jgi:hypothetical protein
VELIRDGQKSRRRQVTARTRKVQLLGGGDAQGKGRWRGGRVAGGGGEAGGVLVRNAKKTAEGGKLLAAHTGQVQLLR